MDYNDIGEQERRKAQFVAWLTKAWDWCGDNDYPLAADRIAELLSHADEVDYPLWYMATTYEVTGPGLLAKKLRMQCGWYPVGPVAGEFERELNYSPVISLDEATWRKIHGQLGWSNRNTDVKMPARNFWLVSSGGNVVRFVIRDVAKEALEAAIVTQNSPIDPG